MNDTINARMDSLSRRAGLTRIIASILCSLIALLILLSCRVSLAVYLPPENIKNAATESDSLEDVLMNGFKIEDISAKNHLYLLSETMYQDAGIGQQWLDCTLPQTAMNMARMGKIYSDAASSLTDIETQLLTAKSLSADDRTALISAISKYSFNLYVGATGCWFGVVAITVAFILCLVFLLKGFITLLSFCIKKRQYVWRVSNGISSVLTLLYSYFGLVSLVVCVKDAAAALFVAQKDGSVILAEMISEEAIQFPGKFCLSFTAGVNLLIAFVVFLVLCIVKTVVINNIYVNKMSALREEINNDTKA